MSAIGACVVLNANFACSPFSAATYDELNTNIGNAYITSSVQKILALETADTFIGNNIWLPDLAPRSLIEASEKADWIFLILQDQLRTSFPDHHYVIALQALRVLNPKAKMVVFSLSANSLDGQSRKLVASLSPARRAFFDYLGQRCESIGVRGPTTAEVLASMGITNVGVVGCPSYFEAGSRRVVDRVENRLDREYVGVTGIFRHHNLPEQFYLQGDADWPLVELLYSPPDEWRRRNLSSAFGPNQWDVDRLVAAADGRTHFFSDLESWKQHIQRNCQLVAGSRLHGAIVALNAGVPAIVTNTDLRARESCEFLGIPYRPDYNLMAPSIAQLRAASDPGATNRLYKQRLGSFEEWLRSLGLPYVAEGACPSATLSVQGESVIRQRAIEVLGSLVKVSRDVKLSVFEPGFNLLNDPDFAEGFQRWSPIARNVSSKNHWSLERDSGGNAASLAISLGRDTDLGYVSDTFDVEPGRDLAISATISVWGVLEGNVFFDLEWLTHDGALTSYSTPLAALFEQSAEIEGIRTVPAGASRARFRFYASNLVFPEVPGRVSLRLPHVSRC